MKSKELRMNCSNDYVQKSIRHAQLDEFIRIQNVLFQLECAKSMKIYLHEFEMNVHECR